MSSSELTQACLTRMLGLALVEIRGAKTLPTAQWLADVFHNVPSNLEAGREPAEIYERMLVCAERWGKTEQLGRMKDWAMGNP